MKQEHAIDLRKAAIIGCGFVGSATAFTLMQSKLFSELVLIDVDKARAEGEAMDISHGMPFAAPMKIYMPAVMMTLWMPTLLSLRRERTRNREKQGLSW